MKEEKDYRDIEIRSDEVQEVMNRIPSWILRWGTTVIFGVVSFIIIGSYWFKYPDKINAQITLTMLDPPTYLVTKVSGKVDSLFVENGSEVKVGQRLALIENVASFQDIDSLKMLLNQWKNEGYDLTYGNQLFGEKTFQLGEVQSTYASFVTLLKDYARFLKQDYYRKKILSVQKQLNLQEAYYSLVKDGLSISEEDCALVYKMFACDSLLFSRKIVVAEEFENSKRNYLQGLSANKNSHMSVAQVELQIEREKSNLVDIQKEWGNEDETYQLNLKNSLEQLWVQISLWEQQYSLIAPISGRLSYIGIWSGNQWVTQGETEFVIAPIENALPIAKAFMPIKGSGKVKVGQQVHIRLNNFPDQEFGYLKGKVSNISPMPIVQEQQNGYVVEIVLPEGMNTNYGKTLPVTREMSGQAEIITEDLRLIERLLQPLKKILKN